MHVVCVVRQAVDNKLLDRAFDITDSSDESITTFICIITDDTDMLPALQKVTSMLTLSLLTP